VFLVVLLLINCGVDGVVCCLFLRWILVDLVVGFVVSVGLNVVG